MSIQTLEPDNDQDVDSRDAELDYLNSILSPEEQTEIESNASKSETTESDGLYNPTNSNNPSGFKSKLAQLNPSGKGKKKYAAIGLGFFSTIMLIAIVVGMLSGIQLDNYIANITAYRLGRSIHAQMRTQGRLEATMTEMAAVDDSKYTAMKEKFGKLRFWSGLDQFRPNLYYKNLGKDGKIKYTTTTEGSGLKRTRITSVEIDGRMTELRQGSKLNPGNWLSNRSERLKFQAQVYAAVDKIVIDEDPIKHSWVRGSISKKIVESTGAKFIRWFDRGKKYDNLKQAAADELELQDRLKAMEEANSSQPRSVTDQLRTAEDDAEKKLQECLKATAGSKECSRQIQNGEVPKEVDSVVTSGVEENFLRKAAQWGSIVNAVAVPMCMIYDGSIYNAKDPIDRETARNMRFMFDMTSARDQAQEGDTTLKAKAATSDIFTNKSGAQSSIYNMMDNKDFDTSDEKSAQASALGTYSLLNVFFPNNKEIVDKINSGATTVCPALTSIGGQTAAVAGELIITAFTGGASKAASAGLEGGVKLAIESTFKNAGGRIVKAFTTKKAFFNEMKTAGIKTTETIGLKKSGERITKGSVGWFAAKYGAFFAGIEGTTAIAKMVVYSHIGAFNNPALAQGPEAVSLLSSGAEAYNAELSRKGEYGRPLLANEYAASYSAALEQDNKRYADKPIFEKYFAISNPRSLTSRLAFSADKTIHAPTSSIASFISSKNIGNIFTFGYLNKRASATNTSNATPANKAHGIVQWDWTTEEENIIDSNDKYNPLNVGLYVDEHKDEISKIDSKYSPCYTETIGTIISKAMIVRDDDGNVINDDGALCSPKNLGLANTNSGEGESVFMWRLNKRYDASLQHMTEVQNATDTNTGGGSNDVVGSTDYTDDTSHTIKDGQAVADGAVKDTSPTTTNCTWAPRGDCINYCLGTASYFWQKYGNKVAVIGNTAYEAYSAAKSAGKVHEKSKNIPIGAIMWSHASLDTDAGRQGHAYIYVGGGKIVSTDINGDHTVGVAPASDIETKWNHTYEGWSDPHDLSQLVSI